MNVPLSSTRLKGCLAVNGWSVAAVFSVKDEGVVFKANWCPLFQSHGQILRLLAECAPLSVPEVLAERTDSRGAWVLMRVIRGQTVQATAERRLLSEMAHQMAGIQTAFSELELDKLETLPRFPKAPEMFAYLLQALRDRYLAIWQQDGAILKRGGREIVAPIPDDFIERLEAQQSRLEDWSDQRDTFGWPMSIHHTDLHPSNAMVEPDGNVRIIDWNRSVMSYPVDSVLWLDTMSDDAQWAGTDTTIQTVKEAYLEAVPWSGDKERVWELSGRLGRIESAYESELLKRTLNYQTDSGGNIASLLWNALGQWVASSD
jgi:hypothetical protein